MTPTQIALVQQSFRKLAPHQETVPQLFYQNLFDLEPALKPLFRGDLRQQGRKLMGMLAMIVGGLERLDSLKPVIRSLGARHAGYGVEERHYGVVGAALLQTLEQGLGSAFAPAVKEAWATAYDILAGEMMAGAAVPQQAAA
jgi:hemoglobin-like flavoprotein